MLKYDECYKCGKYLSEEDLIPMQKDSELKDGIDYGGYPVIICNNCKKIMIKDYLDKYKKNY
jgi:uncharacterized CHY-type Zn-finger protein